MKHRNRSGQENGSRANRCRCAFISVLGGKITGYRAIAEEVADVVCRRLGVQASCRTASLSLPGAPAVSQERVAQSAIDSKLPVETVAHLASVYGSRFTQVLELAQKDSRARQPLCPHSRDILAQVWHAVNEESALTVAISCYGAALVAWSGARAWTPSRPLP